jgi:hypothetical protein
VFQRLIILIFAALVAIGYYPVFLGKVPLPTDVIIQFPAFQSYQNSSTMNTRHGEMGDAMTQWYPWRKQAGESIWQGTLPLWNPHLLAGTPFQADPMAALFYPLNWLFIVLPGPLAWSISFMLKVFLAGFFTALFLREIGASMAGSIIGGLAFAFGGFLTTWIAWTHSDVSIWLPLVCFFTVRLCRTPSWRNAVLLGIPIAMTLLAGHPGVAAYVIFAGGCYGLWITVWDRDSRKPSSIAWFGGAVALGLGFAAIQVVPTIEWLGAIDRSLNTTWGTLAPENLFAPFSRDLSGDPNSAGIRIPGGAMYVGALTLLLAAFAVFHRNKRDVVFCGIVIVLSICSVYGIGPVSDFYDKTPVFKGLKKEEALLLVDFSLAVLAGLGMSRLESFRWDESKAGQRVMLFAVALISTAAFHHATALLSQRTAGGVDWWRSPRSFRFLLVAGAVLILLRLCQVLSSRQWGVAATALLAVDMVSFSHAYFPFNPPGLIFPPAALFDFLKAQPKPFRTISVDGANPINIEPNYGLSAADGYDFMISRVVPLTAGLAAPRNDAIGFQAQGVLSTRNRILDLLNVKYVIASPYNETDKAMQSQPERFREVWSDGHVTLFENLHVLPRALLVPQSRIEVIPNEAGELQRLRDPSFDPVNAVIVSSDAPTPDTATGEPGNLIRFEEGTNWVRLEASAATPSVLVLNQIYYPGWSAYVDGKKAPVFRANYAFTGTFIDAGRHIVEFRFLPVTFLAAAAVSVVTILFAVAAVYRSRSKHKEAVAFARG